MENTVKKNHSLVIKNDTTVTGVTQVVSLEEKEVKLLLGERMLILTGNGFSPEKLSIEEGTLVLAGEVISVKYADKVQAASFFKRLFK